MACTLLTPNLNAQQVALSAPAPEVPPGTKTEAPGVVTPAPAPGTAGQLGHGLDRWLDLSSFTYGARYRSVFCFNGARSFDQGQQKLTADVKFKFDSDGKYGIGFHLSSGRYFNWAYADFIGGGQHQFVDNVQAKLNPFVLSILGPQSAFPAGFFDSGGGQLYLRQLFLTAEPVKGFEAQFGGIAINHGVNTEATSYDDDGYMAGERLTIRRPKQLYFSEFSYTRGYIGDFYQPNFFARGERLATTNYWQILGRKDFGKRLAVSADYSDTLPPGFHTKLASTREGIYASIPESKVVDSVRFEAYQRLDAISIASNFTFPAAKGYAFTLTRRFAKRYSFEAGISNIDADYFVYLGQNGPASILALASNGDQYGLGERYFVRPTIALNSYLSLAGYYSHIFNTTSSEGIEQIWNGQALNAGIVIDAKRLFFPPHTH